MTDDRPSVPDAPEHLEAGGQAGDTAEAAARAGTDADAGPEADVDANASAEAEGGTTADADWRFDRTGSGPGDDAWGAGPRRLERPPSLRYADPGASPAGEAGPARMPTGRDDLTGGSDDAMPSGPRWAVGIGVFAALIPSAILVVFASVFGFTAGLVVVGIFVGRIVGISVRGAPNSGLTSDARTLVAIVITLVALALSQVAIWLLALREGGDLPLLDFLAQTYGPVVPLEAMLGVVAAWWSAR